MVRTLITVLLAFPALARAADCPDYAADPAGLRDLEEYASRGALSDEEKDCLEASYARATEQTTKDKISRVLMVNGYAYDTDYWATLVARHLEEVDRSDPDIAYLYAYYLYNQAEPGDMQTLEEVVRWTETALERKDVWTGAVHVARVYGLMRLRAFATYDLWHYGEEARVRGEIAEDEVRRLRNEAKTYAREWVDMARSSGRDPHDAFTLCTTMASAAACGRSPN